MATVVATPQHATYGFDTNVDSRVPQTLQAVFLQSQRGKEVHRAPPNRIAMRSFRRWFGFGGEKSDTWSSDDESIMARKPSFSMKKIKRSGSPKANMRKTSLDMSSHTDKSLDMSEHSTSSMSMNSTTLKHHVSTQKYLSSLLKNRGYSGVTFSAKESAYYNKPTPLQIASYGAKVTEAIRSDNINLLRELMELGLSPNACNDFGESIVHLVCRMGKKDMLQVLLDNGCNVQVSDDYGRTPLHDASWSTQINFDLIDLLLEQDPRMICVQDARGALPLSYLQPDQWTPWTKYLMSRKNRFWPERCVAKNGVEADHPLAVAEPNSQPIPDPEEPISLDLAKMVAQGRLEPAEAAMLKYDDDEESSDEDYMSGDSMDEEDDDSMFDSSEEEDDDDITTEVRLLMEESESEFDTSEMQEILGVLTMGCLGGKKPRPLAWT